MQEGVCRMCGGKAERNEFCRDPGGPHQGGDIRYGAVARKRRKGIQAASAAGADRKASSWKTSDALAEQREVSLQSLSGARL